MKKSNLLLIIFTIFGSCDCSQEPLVQSLGNPCYVETDGRIVEISLYGSKYGELNIGECSTGLTNKDEKGNLVCWGEIKPEEEDCNNLDDNCNGLIDDDYSGYELSRPYYSLKNSCIPYGVCRYAEQKCVNGEWICLYPDDYGKEICDGKDNDCDMSIDEDTDEDPIFSDGERYVYTADPDTINIGECRAGYKECVDGVVSIRNMRTPITEICGNDDDDDCDGVIDEIENESVQNDFALIIDYSGSMGMVVESVADALCSWTSQGVLQNSRFAVIGIGYADGTEFNQMKVLVDFTDSGTACSVIRAANRPQFSGGMELQLDATYNANDPASTTGFLSWSASNRKVMIFSDELMQEEMFSSVEDGIEAVVQQCNQEGYTIGAFIRYDIEDQALWVDLTQRCGGFLDYLSYNPQEMIDTLNYWIGTDC
jgi:hypothetical protein